MAFVIAALIFIVTLFICFLMVMSSMHNPIPPSGANIVWTFIGGTTFAILIAASHWLPHIGW